MLLTGTELRVFWSVYLKLTVQLFNQPPAIQIRLCQSAFGLGELYDKLILSTKETRYTNQFHITTTMVVALIEGVLGYDPILSQGTWSFRRDTEYKTL